MKLKIQKPKPKIILKDSYLQVIKNSVGSKIFRNLFFDINGKKKDILGNGKLSCAFYVSSILYLFKLIEEPHTTVNGLVKDLVKSGWKLFNKPKIGSILVWELYKGHYHIGFYIAKNKAISNNSVKKHSVLHHWTFGNRLGKPKRQVIKIFWHKSLG